MHNINHISESTIIILCTLPNDKDLALKLIKTLLQLKLAACISLFNKVYSYYYWNENITTSLEIQILIKTKNSLQKTVFNKIKEIHPYQIPELLVIPIINGELNYLNWIHSNLK